ncbi:hypothetical protein BHE74_00057968 [Ensete ventricosum]|nr:hypothetical protein BHE74_00057968 [Ensete ventricosum]
MEQTFIMIKPDGVQRGLVLLSLSLLVGEIISRFEKKGFYLKGEEDFGSPVLLGGSKYLGEEKIDFFVFFLFCFGAMDQSGLKMMNVDRSFAQKHYADLSAKPFFPGLVEYVISGPVVAMVWEGKNVVVTGRKIIGATNPSDSSPGTIRGDYAIVMGR